MTDPRLDGMPDTPPEPGVPVTDTGITPAEAAAILGVSERTVIRRLNKGMLRGYKVDAGRGDVWRVLLDGVTDTRTDEHGAVTDTPIVENGAVTDRAAGTNVLGSEPSAGLSPSESRRLLDLMDALRQDNAVLASRNEQLAGQLGFVQAKLQEAEKTIALLMAPKDPESAAEAAPVPRRPWWKRILRRGSEGTP